MTVPATWNVATSVRRRRHLLDDSLGDAGLGMVRRHGVGISLTVHSGFTDAIHHT